MNYAAPESLKIMLELLPEEYRLNLLKMIMNNKIAWEALIKNKIEFVLENKVFHDSFVPQYLRILILLISKIQPQENGLGFLSLNLKRDAIQLIKSLTEKNTFAEIEETLIKYARINQDTYLGKEILECLNVRGSNFMTKEIEIVKKRDRNEDDSNSEDETDLKKIKLN